VVNNTVGVPPRSCPAYRTRSSNIDVSCGCGTSSRPANQTKPIASCSPPYKGPPPKKDPCECGTSSRAKKKANSLPNPPRETRQYCMDSSPSDYVENQHGNGVFTRNPITVSSYDVKINPCPRQPKEPVYSNETLNERKVSCQHYCCPAIQDPPRDPARKCKPCNKSKSKPKRAPSRKNSSCCVAPVQPSTAGVDRTLYVPPSWFTATTCPVKRKRITETRRGRSCSGVSLFSQ